MADLDAYVLRALALVAALLAGCSPAWVRAGDSGGLGAPVVAAVDAHKHAWMVRVCASYFPDSSCRGGEGDEFPAAYTVSAAAWVAICRDPVSQGEDRTVDVGPPAVTERVGCNQYTRPLYVPLGSVRDTDLLFVIDSAADWGETLVRRSEIGPSLMPLVDPRGPIWWLFTVSFGLLCAVGYTVAGLLRGLRSPKRGAWAVAKSRSDANA